MTKKDFFILLIKIFGLFSVVLNIFSILPSSFSYAFMDLGTFAVAWIIITVLIVIGLFVLLIYKADNIVTLLNLEKGFDEDRIDFGNLKSADIIKIATFIIGGLLILNNIPNFLGHTLFAFKNDVVGIEYNTHDKFSWLIDGINIIIGYLLITNLNFVAKIFTKDKMKK